MDKNNLAGAKRKFEVAYFVAKQLLPITKYEQFLKLERMHGVDIGPAYLTDQYCGIFIHFCGNEIKKQLTSDLSKAKFLSVLCDDSTGSSVKENKAVFQSDTRKFGLLESMFTISRNELRKRSDSLLLNHCFRKSFELIEIQIKNKRIGFTSDGASVNRGDKNSVKTNLRTDSPRLVFIWCIVHRVELDISDDY